MGLERDNDRLLHRAPFPRSTDGLREVLRRLESLRGDTERRGDRERALPRSGDRTEERLGLRSMADM